MTLTHVGGPETEALELVGGLAGVVQDAGTLALQPVLGWAVRTMPAEGRITKTAEERRQEVERFNAWVESRRQVGF